MQTAKAYQDKSVSEIYKTTDYNRFKIMNGNRNISKQHLERIKLNILKKYVMSPILVNERFEIVDGQHRFTALKELKLPVFYYMITGLTIDECQLLNSYSSNWTNMDYIKSFSKIGNKNYQMIIKFSETYPFMQNAYTIIYLLQGKKTSSTGSLLANIKTGEFELSMQGYEAACRVAEKMKDFSKVTKEYTHTLFQRAIMQIIMHPSYDHDRMLSKMESVGSTKFKKCSSINDYYKILSEIYNYRARKGDEIYFEIEFKN